MRRVVTGHNKDGKAIITHDGPSPTIAEFANYHPGYRIHELWFTSPHPKLLTGDEDPAIKVDHFIPALGETRFMIMELPPDAEVEEMIKIGAIDFDKAMADFFQKMPDMAAANDPDHPGMHITDSIDYIIVLSGEVWCELDDGLEIHLKPSDTLVQCGTRHVWRNQGDKPCVMAGVMVGVSRE